MKINELSKLSRINIETIRMYRQKGFLKPKKLENGYYDYSMADFTSLIYLRKFRELNFSIDQINTYEQLNDDYEMLQILDEELGHVNNQIELLKQKAQFLEFEKRHIRESPISEIGGARTMQSIDDKIDFYGTAIIDGFTSNFNPTSFYLNSSSTVRISKDVLNGECKDQYVPMDIGIGSYRYMLEARKIPVPANAVVIPNGLYITQMISIRNTDTIDVLDLKPMMNCAKKMGKKFISDTTGYLCRVRSDEQGLIFDYRLRACIEVNDVKDRELQEKK